MRYAFLTLLLAISFAPAYLYAQDKLVASDSFAVVGKPLTLSFDSARAADLALTVIYRPNSATEQEVAVGGFDKNGTRIWIPEAPGLAALQAKNEEGDTIASLDIAVCFSEIPKSGIGVMVFAGLLLFGGAGVSLFIALRRIL